jgi:hypothetical protein
MGQVMTNRIVLGAAGALSIGLALGAGCGSVTQSSHVPDATSPAPGPSDSWAARGQGAPRALFAEWSAVHGCALDPRGGDFAQCTDLSVRVSSAAVTPSGNWAFVFGEDRLQSFRMNDDGRLDAIDAVPEKCSGPGNAAVPHVFVHPTRRLAYVRCSNYVRADPPTSGWNVVSSFDVFQVDPAGRLGTVPSASSSIPTLSPSSNGSIAGTRAGEDMAIHPTRDWAYFANPPFVERYQVLETGAFVLLDRTPASFTETSHALAIDPQGSFLFTSGVQAFKIDATTGQLTLASSLPSPAEQVQTDPRGRWVFLVRPDRSAGRVIDTYVLNRGSGALTLVATSPAPPYHHGNFTSVPVEPNGQFLYFVSTVHIDEYAFVYEYRIEPDGRLTASGGHSFSDYPVELALFRGPGASSQ